MQIYRERTWQLIYPLVSQLAPLNSVLDFGAGDGWFAERIRSAQLAREVIAFDTQIRPLLHHEVTLIDGGRLPLADLSCDLTYAIDVLHHCLDPVSALREILRCTKSWLLIKDHTYCGPIGFAVLCILDELGNRRLGIPSPYHYQYAWKWNEVMQAAGFKLETLVHPAACNRGLLGATTNHLQFIGLWKRVSE